MKSQVIIALLSLSATEAYAVEQLKLRGFRAQQPVAEVLELLESERDSWLYVVGSRKDDCSSIEIINFFDPKAYTPENIYLDYESIALLARGGVKLIKAETGGKFIGCVNFPLPYGDGTVWFDSDSKLSRMKFNCRFFGACGMATEAFIDALIESQSVEFRSASFGRKFEPYFNEQFNLSYRLRTVNDEVIEINATDDDGFSDLVVNFNSARLDGKGPRFD